MAAVEHLGITVDDVRAQRISPQIAERIVKKHTDLSVKDITALAFTLALCPRLLGHRAGIRNPSYGPTCRSRRRAPVH